MIILQTTTQAQASPIYSIIGILVIVLPIVAVTLYIFRKRLFRRMGSVSDKFKFGIINEARNLEFHEINKSEIKDIGKYAFFKFGGGDYFIHRKALIKSDNVATLIYRYNDPVPFTFDRASDGKEINQMSAAEVKEAQDSKVVFDLLRFTLSKVETLFVIIVLINFVVSLASVYFSYSANNTANGINETLKSLIRLLFPQTTPG